MYIVVLVMAVFGSNGAVGSALQEEGDPASFRFYSRANRLGSGFHYDLSDQNTLKNLDLSEVDTVLFLSALSSPKECDLQPQLAKKLNFVNTKQTLDYLLEMEKTVFFASTDLVYRGGEGRIYSELSECDPQCLYGELKLRIEEEFRSIANFHALRFSNVVSPFTNFLQPIFSGVQSEFFSDLFRHSVCFKDILHFLSYAMKSSPSANIINVGGKNVLSRYELVKLLFPDSISLKIRAAVSPEDIGVPKKILLDTQLFWSLMSRGDSLSSCLRKNHLGEVSQ